MTKAIIFCNRKRDIASLVKDLSNHGIPASPLHGDMNQHLRTKTLGDFRSDSITYLVASDVAARGLDVTNVSHVFNYDVPTSPDDYVHRIGRTGRAGREGRAFMLATPEDGKYVDAIARLLGKAVNQIEIPGVMSASPGEMAETEERPRRKQRRGGHSRKQEDDKNPRQRHESTSRHSAKTAPTSGGARDVARNSSISTASDRNTPARDNSASHALANASSGGQRQRNQKAAAQGMGKDVPAFLLRQLPGDKDKK